MRITAAILADHVAVRDGVLNLLGGGINRLSKVAFPARMDATLALMVSPKDVEDMMSSHIIDITITDEYDKQIVEFRLKWPGLSSVDEVVSPLPSIPLVVPISDIQLPQAGLYRLAINMDGKEDEALEFVAHQVPEPTGASVSERPTERHNLQRRALAPDHARLRGAGGRTDRRSYTESVALTHRCHLCGQRLSSSSLRRPRAVSEYSSTSSSCTPGFGGATRPGPVNVGL
jgi:ribosomal protein L34E